MEEEDVYDDTITNEPVHSIKAFINQFEKPNSLPINTKPVKPVKPTKPIQILPKPVKPDPPNKMGFVIKQDELTKGRLKKVEVSNNTENKSGLPPNIPRKPAVAPRQQPKLPTDEKENDSKEKLNGEQSSFNSIKNKFNQAMKPNTNILIEKKNSKEIQENFASDKIYYSEGKKYKMLKLQEVSGPAPEKPQLPPDLDIYEFLGADIDEEVYEEYDDVELKPQTDMALNEKTDDDQELYDDTEVDGMAMNGRTPSLIDDDYYEALPDQPNI